MEKVTDGGPGVGEHLELVRMFRKLQPFERELVTLFVRRLLWGQGHYGPFQGGADGRNLLREGVEECLDGFVYVAAHLARAAKERD